MALNLTSPVTGGAQTGFTTPGFTLAADQPINNNSKQWYVSALTGTQTGNRIHSISDPFTVAVSRPANPKVLPNTGNISVISRSVPRNEYKVIVRGGLIPGAGYPAIPVPMICSLPIPAGADVYDLNRARGMISLLVGALNQLSAEIGNTVASGSI